MGSYRDNYHDDCAIFLVHSWYFRVHRIGPERTLNPKPTDFMLLEGVAPPFVQSPLRNAPAPVARSSGHVCGLGFRA